MTSLHGRELEDEFLWTARELAGDVESREAGDRYLLTTHALYHGGPVSWAMTPKIFDVAQIEILRDAAEMSNMEGLFLFNGKFGGVFTRCGMDNVIGEWTHRLNMGCLVVA